MDNQELQVVDQQSNYVPSLSMTPDMANQLIHQLDELKKKVLRNKVDYDIIPGTPKPSLLKPGAERLLMCFGLGHRVHEVRVVEDWENGFFHYVYKVTIHKSYPTHEVVVAECIGSANSKESRYRDRWVYDNVAKEMGLNPNNLEKKQKTSQKGKPYFVYKVENPDPYSIVNTLQKMAIKRALVGATLQATGTSEFFTQDLEDMPSQANQPEPEPPTPTQQRKKQTTQDKQKTQKSQQQRQEQQTTQGQQQNTQPTEEERKAKGIKLMYTEATNKGLNKEEQKAILEAETKKQSAKDLSLDELLRMYTFFKETPAKLLKETAQSILNPQDEQKTKVYDVDPETGEATEVA